MLKLLSTMHTTSRPASPHSLSFSGLRASLAHATPGTAEHARLTAALERAEIALLPYLRFEGPLPARDAQADARAHGERMHSGAFGGNS